jgi:predicted MPP superfamily phosphohydrolase
MIVAAARAGVQAARARRRTASGRGLGKGSGLGPGDLRRLSTAGLLLGAAVFAAATTSRAALASLGAAAALALLWARFVEPRLLAVTRVRVETARRDARARPIRVVHVTDLQCDPTPRLEERLPGVVAGLRPDAIVFTGDAVNSAGGAPVFRRCLSRLAEIAPTFAVTGNWEVWNVPEVDPYGGTGATLLEGSAARVALPGGDLWVAGVGADGAARAEAALAAAPEGAPLLFLHHYPDPDVVPEGSRARVDLMLSGHVHGGQVAVPLYGAILTLARHGKRYERGLYDVPPMRLFVGRGIGMEGKAPRLRFASRPEVALIEIGGRPRSG